MCSSSSKTKRRFPSGFTLVELMVSVTILVILMLVVANFVALVQRTWVRTNSNVAQFREARQAFDILVRNVGQATLNTYYQSQFDVVGKTLGQDITKATTYRRQSELQFVCGPTVGGSNSLFASGAATTYPGHGVFFQAPLGVTNSVDTSSGGTGASTSPGNLVNLLCGRGYFVAWGSDTPFRPTFLQSTVVPPRFRLRLMEFSPLAEQNPIYNASLRPVTDNSKAWFSTALASVTTGAETSAATHAVTRPVAENILVLVISPQLETTGRNAAAASSIAPNYYYDSTLVTNPGASSVSGASQGTQHLLPPLLKITMVALDHLGGERLSRESSLQSTILGQVATMFQSVSAFTGELGGTGGTPGTLDKLLRQNKLNYRVFTTTISMRQARWSM